MEEVRELKNDEAETTGWIHAKRTKAKKNLLLRSKVNDFNEI